MFMAEFLGSRWPKTLIKGEVVLFMGFPWQDGNVYAEHSGTDKLTGQSYLHTAVLGVSYLVHY